MHDNELIAAVRAGDREAFGVLVERHQSAVYRLCRRMTGNGPDAEDLAHQAFIEAWLKLDQLRDADRFGAWLRMIVLNVCRMWYRRRKRDFAPLSEGVDAAAPVEPHAASMRAQVALGLTRLPAPHRLVLVLHYLEGLSYKEMSEFLGVPQGTVMSRLHRARAALRGALDEWAEEEEDHVSFGEEFKREVDAEIGVLLRMSEGERRKADRLAAVLQHAPDRLARLICEGDETLHEDLARLMPRLGGDALRTVLHLWSSGGPEEREQAAGLLERSVIGLRARASGPEGHASGSMPSRYVYFLCDAVIAASANPEDKVELLLRLIEAAKDEGTLALFTSLMLCWPNEAFSRLMGRFTSDQSPEDLFRTPDTLYALCRFGKRFAEALVTMLHSTDTRTLRLALAGAEGLARARDPEELRDATPDHRFNEVRTRRKWAPLTANELPQSIVEAMAAPVATLVDNTNAAVRETALRVLGLLKAESQREAVIRGASHEEPSTRTTALVALGELGGPAAANRAMTAAASDHAAERRTAVEVLARLQAEEARPLFMRLLVDPDRDVRLAVVSALGELDGEADRAELQRLLKSEDRAVARAAAKALYREQRPVRRPASETELKRLERAERTAKPFTDISIDAAFRFALTENRTYAHRELSTRLAAVCSDFSATRRYAVEEGALERLGDDYRFTELGETVWRVEQYILGRYLKDS